MAMKQVHNQSHVYMSSILLNKSHEHIINCVVNNSFWRKKGSYTYKLDSNKAKGNYFASRNTWIVIFHVSQPLCANDDLNANWV